MKQFRTMSKKVLAVELGVSDTKLYRDMKKLDKNFLKRVKRKLLYDEDVKYICENIKGVRALK